MFVDTSIWFAAVNDRDEGNAQARKILKSVANLITSTFVLEETWRLISHRIGWSEAEAFWSGIRRGIAELEPVTTPDLDSAYMIGQRYPDQKFSLTDRTSFAVMERRGIHKVASFDSDFLIYRFGNRNNEAFEVLK
jgi:predicted nucleic acid-binding protein